VERGLEHLARPEREVLVLSLLGGRSFREIATITGQAPDVVGQLASRGLAALADELGPLLAPRASATLTAVPADAAATVPSADGSARAPGPQGVLR